MILQLLSMTSWGCFSRVAAMVLLFSMVTTKIAPIIVAC